MPLFLVSNTSKIYEKEDSSSITPWDDDVFLFLQKSVLRSTRCWPPSQVESLWSRGAGDRGAAAGSRQTSRQTCICVHVNVSVFSSLSGALKKPKCRFVLCWRQVERAHGYRNTAEKTYLIEEGIWHTFTKYLLLIIHPKVVERKALFTACKIIDVNYCLALILINWNNLMFEFPTSSSWF